MWPIGCEKEKRERKEKCGNGHQRSATNDAWRSIHPSSRSPIGAVPKGAHAEPRTSTASPSRVSCPLVLVPLSPSTEGVVRSTVGARWSSPASLTSLCLTKLKPCSAFQSDPPPQMGSATTTGVILVHWSFVSCFGGKLTRAGRGTVRQRTRSTLPPLFAPRIPPIRGDTPNVAPVRL